MAVSRRQIYVCDIHDNNGEEVIISNDQYFGFDGEWWKIGLCVVCDKEQIAAFRELVKQLGIKVPASEVIKPGGGIVTTTPSNQAQVQGKKKPSGCLFCDWRGSVGAYNAHVVRHGFATAGESYGGTCPLCGESGWEALGRHAKAHQIESVFELFQSAIAAGDPHGVVAERLKAAS
jgi:hypothetical protein